MLVSLFLIGVFQFPRFPAEINAVQYPHLADRWNVGGDQAVDYNRPLTFYIIYDFFEKYFLKL